MAAQTVRAVRLAMFSGAAVPLLGFRGRLSAMSPDDEVDGGDEDPQIVRACDIPLYPVSRKMPELQKQDTPEPNAVEEQITKIRKSGQSIYNEISDGYEVLKEKADIGVEHSKSALNYVQTNPRELPRVAFISVATMGGVVVGYRRGIMRKVLYAGIAGVSAAALCYPNQTVDLSNAVTEDAKHLWRDNIGWPLSDDSKNAKSKPKESGINFIKKALMGKEDHGQSKAEDKDLYSTRSS